jgi:hypothetical protein
MEGLEPTSHGGTIEMPTIEPLGLETNAAPGLHADAPAPVPLDGLDTIPLDVSSLPSAPPAAPAPASEASTIEIPAVSAPEAADDGLLDLGSFSIGGSAAAPAAPAASETPIDGGHDAGAADLIDLDFDTPAPAPAAAPIDSLPTMVVEAVKNVVPAVQDAMESAAPAVMDFVDTTIPAVVDTVKSAVVAVAETPTVIMQAIKPPETPAVPAAPAAERPSQSIPFVTETMAQLYLSQGHRAEAIDIYRKLIDARPNDNELKSRLAAIENAPREMPSPEAAAPVNPAPARFAGTGPSIRVVLRELFGFDGTASYSSSAPQAPASGGGVPAEVGSIDLLFSAAPLSDSLNPLAVAFDGGYVAGQGSIDDLFSGHR